MKKVNTSILDSASDLVRGSRKDTYGDTNKSFTRLADLFTGLLNHKLTEPITPHEVALLLIQLKVSRSLTSPTHRDSLVDIAGYALIASELNH